MRKEVWTELGKEKNNMLLPCCSGFYVLTLKDCAKFKGKECQISPVLSEEFLKKNLGEISPDNHLFLKIHRTRGNGVDRKLPPRRVLFVMNIPSWASIEFLKKTFKRVGDVEEVIFREFNDASGKLTFRSIDEPRASGASCHMIFSCDIDESRVYSVATYKDIDLDSNYFPEISIYGIGAWISAYKKSFPECEDVLEYINEYMSVFDLTQKEKRDEMERKAIIPDEEGFVLVSEKKSSKRLRESEKQKIRKESKHLTDFYRFQTREVKKEKFLNLHEKFENDRKRIQELKKEGHYQVF